MGTRRLHKKNRLVPRITVNLVGLGARIREIRGPDMVQEEFAQILGIGQTQLSRYELGQSAPTLEILLKLRVYSHKSVDWILLGDDAGND